MGAWEVKMLHEVGDAMCFIGMTSEQRHNPTIMQIVSTCMELFCHNQVVVESVVHERVRVWRWESFSL